jgi:hypothetical protein
MINGDCISGENGSHVALWKNPRVGGHFGLSQMPPLAPQVVFWVVKHTII